MFSKKVVVKSYAKIIQNVTGLPKDDFEVFHFFIELLCLNKNDFV